MSEEAFTPGEDLTERLRQFRAPFVDLIGLRLDRITAEELTATLELDPERHMQPYGIVHGGVYASIGETLASLGAAINASRHGRQAVGLENHTSFIRALRGGAVAATARPLHNGRSVALWEVEMRDAADGRLVARSTVRLALPEPRG
jgi:uncharacterized protein (TIGR00369 family)